MMDVGLVELGVGGVRNAEPLEARIAGLARVGGRDRIDAERIEIVRATLIAVGDLLGTATGLDQVVAVARLLQECELLLDALARKRIVLPFVERDQLGLAVI